MKKSLLIMSVPLVFAMVGMSSPLFAAVPGAVQAGTVVTVKGEANATTPPDTAAHALKIGDPVFMGDRIETGKDSQLQVQLLDQTVFTLGSSSGFTVDEFVYDPATDNGKVKTTMVKGIFRIISGNVAHKNPDNMTVNLPAGSMGFRGTDVVGIINGTRTQIILVGPVGVGRIYVTNLVNGEVVTVDVDEAGYATIVDGPNSVPTTIFQVSAEELQAFAEELGLPALVPETYTEPGAGPGDGMDPGADAPGTSGEYQPQASPV